MLLFNDHYVIKEKVYNMIYTCMHVYWMCIDCLLHVPNVYDLSRPQNNFGNDLAAFPASFDMHPGG